MSFFSSNGTLLLLHKRLESVKKASKYDLVLSPQFYVAKKEKLPVKYAFQAKKLAPSILDDLLPADDNYVYDVKKDGDSWLIFAYSPKEIEDFLRRCCNINASRIGKIYFADQLKEILKKVPIGVDEQNALTLVDNYATIVPRNMLQSDKFARFTKKLRPKHSYSFKSSTRTTTDTKLSKKAIVLASLAALFGLFFFLDGFGYKKALNQEQEKLNALYAAYPALQSDMVRENLKEKYEKKEKRQRAIRDLLDSFSQLTSKKSILYKLDLQKDKLVGNFLIDPSEKKKVLSIAAGENLRVRKVSTRVVAIEGDIK